MTSVWRKLWDSVLVRYIFVLISLLFIAGGSLNDGPTGIFWALPFICLLYFSFPFKRKIKTAMTIIVILLMIGVSGFKGSSSIVYPVIGQKVTMLEDIPLRDWGEDGVFYDYEWYYDAQQNEHHSAINTGKYVPKGSIFTVTRVETISKDLGTYPAYVLSDGKNEFLLKNLYLGGFLGETADELKYQAFCTKVIWEYCSLVDFNHIGSWYSLDPMNNRLRFLINLMYYPVLPFLVYEWIKINT